MPNQTQQAEHKEKPSSQRESAKPVGRGPVAPALQSDAFSVQRALADPTRAQPADILARQRLAGNRAVARLIQAKLMIGPAEALAFIMGVSKEEAEQQVGTLR